MESARTPVRLPLTLAVATLLVAGPLSLRAAAADSITLTASPAAVTYGNAVQLSGQITGDAACIASRTIQLEWRAANAGSWSDVDTTTTDADGAFALSNRQDYNGRYRASADASSSCASVVSAEVVVRVRAFVDTALSGSLVVGGCADIDVGVSPPKPTERVDLQRRTPSGWQTVDTLALDADSSANATPCFRWQDLGIARLRVRWPQQDDLNTTGTGITLTLRIAKAPWMLAIDDAIGKRSVSVALADSGQTMFERADASPRRPASNEKLLLSMALLQRFGPAHRIPTIAAAASVRHGVVRGDLWILGRGDPEIGPARLRLLARELEARGVRAVRGRVMGATTYFRHDWWARGWQPGFRDYVALPTALTFHHNVVNRRAVRLPEVLAAASLRKQLRRVGISVPHKPGAGAPPSGLSPVAEVSSHPLEILLARMDRPSDNFYAEVLGKALGVARSGPPGTIHKAANAIMAFTRAHGTNFSLYDSSGLSYDDRVTAAGMVRLLAYADGAPWGVDLRRALPAGGQGTLEGRLRDVQVHAKTGTLDGVSALSGWVWLEKESRWAEFSILDAGMIKSRAVSIEDKIVHIIANRATIAS